MSSYEYKFWKKIVLDFKTGCWNWVGKPDVGGYCRWVVGNKNILVHRSSFELFKGKIMEGLQIDHLCRNTKCVNPNHLEAVTARTNVLRSNNRAANQHRQTRCIRGHLLYGENLRIRDDGSRQCITCQKFRRRRYFIKNKK